MLSSIVLFLAVAASAHACSCDGPDLRTRLCKAKYVVVGAFMHRRCDNGYGGLDKNGFPNYCRTSKFSTYPMEVYRRDGGKLTKIENRLLPPAIDVITPSTEVCGVGFQVRQMTVFTTEAQFYKPEIRVDQCSTIFKHEPTKSEIEKFIADANKACN